MNDPTIIRTFSDRGEAEIARGLLEAEGIPAELAADDMAQTGPALDIAAGIQLVVEAEDADRAIELLDQPTPEDELDAAERETEGPPKS
ncbi:MAG TPA: DUF2007 domain-containing protein [Candidatus Sulfotelmatobacter sp.]|jgi:hypothetical protein|nr:DUF2007 domain-containing protein [Candidatus Sulfotelmatobacter sp.]